MKVRIKGNSVRLRLTKPEVDAFCAGNTISEETHFPDGNVLGYALAGKKDGLELSADFRQTTITIYMPDHLKQIWGSTETVGFEAHQPLPSGSKLFILVEKDWKCLDGTSEDQTDMYPNPNEHLHP